MSSQREIRDAQRDVKSDLAFDRQWLQRYRATGSTDQHLGAQTEAQGNVAAGTYVISSERALPDLAVSRKHCPEQRSTSCYTDIDANAPDRAPVDVLLARCASDENTSHVLPRAEDESDPGIGVARQSADPKRRPRLRSCRAGKNGQECACEHQTTDELERKTARPVPLLSAINPHDGVLTGTAIRNFRKAIWHV
jgi:hypothetical protein